MATVKVVIYTRVSTDDQKEHGFSLQDQEQKLRKFCSQKGYEIVAHYQDDHSAKTFKRPSFQLFLDDVEAKKIKLNLFVCVRPDRFSRNLEETMRMLQRFKKLNISFETVENHVELNTPESMIPFMLQMLLPQVDNERRGLNTKAGMRQALREGKWVHRAPIGYKNDRLTKTIVVDESKANLVVEAFNLYVKELYTAEEIRLVLRRKGLACSKQNFLNMLENPLYAGMIPISAYKDEPEQLVVGLHQPLITTELFNEVQAIRKGRRKPLMKVNSTRSETLLLRGFLECKQCGRQLAGSGSKSRNGGKHYYYHCQCGCKERFRADQANKDFELFLSSFKPSSEMLSLYYLILEDTFKTDDHQRLIEAKQIDEQISKLKGRIERIEDEYVDGNLNTQEYHSMKSRFEESRNELIYKHGRLIGVETSFKQYMKYGFSLLHNLSEYYQQAPFEVKQKVIGSIFPERLIYSGNQYRTKTVNSFVSLMCNQSTGYRVEETEKTTLSRGLSSLAPEAGLEPATL